MNVQVAKALGFYGAAEGTCGLFHCPLDWARLLLPHSVPWDTLPHEVREKEHAVIPSSRYVVDVKVHKLMPEQWPCIPNWHYDFIPRDPDTLQEDFSKVDPSAVMWMWLSGGPYTEFRDGREVPAHTWIPFTQKDEHRGTPAQYHSWRTFVRLTPIHLMRAGLPGEIIPAPPDQWVRRHAQVYLDAEKYRW